MNIYIDENIPCAKDFFSELGNLHFFSGRDLSAEQVKDADILLVRSITKVNKQLLDLNKTIKFVGTATIGTDHVDIEYLNKRGIAFSSAPGCNKISVGEYILSCVLLLSEKYQFQIKDKTVAIVGAGNTGSSVYKCLNALGANCILYDPPLKQKGDLRDFCSFDDVLNADIISLHVPKILDGDNPTYHMFDEKVLKNLSTDQILLNASRGEIIDNQALLEQAKLALTPTLVLDVWENEPNIEKALLPFVDIATPHIAGYSLEGKLRGTQMLYQAVCELIDIMPVHKLEDFIVEPEFNSIVITNKLDENYIKSLVHLVYDVRRDHYLFRQMIEQKDGFDTMRKTYKERRELSTLKVDSKEENSQVLQELGFSI